MTTKTANPTVLAVSGAVLLLAFLGGVFALVWHGSIAGTLALAVIAPVAAAAGAALGVSKIVTSTSAAQASATKSAIEATQSPPPAA